MKWSRLVALVVLAVVPTVFANVEAPQDDDVETAATNLLYRSPLLCDRSADTLHQVYDDQRAVFVFDAVIKDPVQRIVSILLLAEREIRHFGTQPKYYGAPAAFQHQVAVGRASWGAETVRCVFAGQEDQLVKPLRVFDDDAEQSHTTAVECQVSEDLWSKWLAGSVKAQVSLKFYDTKETFDVGPIGMCLPEEVYQLISPENSAATSAKKPFYVSVCSSPLIAKERRGIFSFFGDNAAFSSLLQWIEHHRNVGVEHFYLYDVTALVKNKFFKSRYRQILNQYIEDGVVTLIPFDDWSDRKFFHTNSYQEQAQMHCVNKYGAASQWIGMFDPDEFWIPLKERSVVPMLQDVFVQAPTAGEVLAYPVIYTFCEWNRIYSGSIFDRCPKKIQLANGQEPERMRGRYTKYFMRPELVDGPGVHKVLRFRDNSVTHVEVDPTRMRVNHYISMFYERNFMTPEEELKVDKIASKRFGADLKKRMKAINDPIIRVDIME